MAVDIIVRGSCCVSFILVFHYRPNTTIFRCLLIAGAVYWFCCRNDKGPSDMETGDLDEKPKDVLAEALKPATDSTNASVVPTTMVRFKFISSRIKIQNFRLMVRIPKYPSIRLLALPTRFRISMTNDFHKILIHDRIQRCCNQLSENYLAHILLL